MKDLIEYLGRSLFWQNNTKKPSKSMNCAQGKTHHKPGLQSFHFDKGIGFLHIL